MSVLRNYYFHQHLSISIETIYIFSFYLDIVDEIFYRRESSQTLIDMYLDFNYIKGKLDNHNGFVEVFVELRFYVYWIVKLRFIKTPS